MKFQNIYQLFREQTAKYRGEAVFYLRENDVWKTQNWEDFEDRVHDFASALLAKGLTKGASVAILAGNVPEWTIAGIATIAAGGIGVGIYPTSSPEQCECIINHSDAEFVVVDTQIPLAKILQIFERLPKVKNIICLDESAIDALKLSHVRQEKILPSSPELPCGWSTTKSALAISFQEFLSIGEIRKISFSRKSKKPDSRQNRKIRRFWFTPAARRESRKARCFRINIF